MCYHLKIKQIEEDTGCYRPKVETKDYNVIIGGKNFFDQPVRNYIRTYENIRKIATGQGNDLQRLSTRSFLFQRSYKLTALDLNEQEVVDANSKVVLEFL